MSELDSILRQAVERKDIPFGVAMVANRDGVLWSGAQGDAREGTPAGPDTVYRFWSMTKAVGSLAATILIDRGQLSMDTKVADILPAFGDLRVIESIGGGQPMVLRPPRTQATVRHLLTHTSGIAYPLFDDKMIQYMQEAGLSYVMKGTVDELNTPLMFDPGEGWVYGIGLDWVGYLIQEVTGRSIDRFCIEEIFEPLGMEHTGFEPELVEGALAQAYARTADGSLTPTEFAPPAHPELYMLGSALHGTAGDYLRFLQLILAGGELDGNRIVSDEAMALLTENQMGDLRIPGIVSCDQVISADVTLLAEETPMSHTAGFLRTEKAVEGRRAAGSLWWAGFLNTHFWIDPANDVAAVLMTQTLPFCDPRCIETLERFERAVYRTYA